MKSNAKRITALLMALTMGASTMIGCSSGKIDPAKAAENTQAILDSKEYIDAKYCQAGEAPEFTGRLKLALLVFFAAFAVMIYGVVSLGWWFGEMTGLFFVASILIGLILGFSEKEMVNEFLTGAGEMIGVALVCGVARSINMVLDGGLVSDAMLDTMSGWVDGMNPYMFAIMMYFIYIILGFFINSQLTCLVRVQWAS